MPLNSLFHLRGTFQGGFGEFVRERIQGYSPRHASAIAAILVYLGDLEFKGKKPIWLRRRYSE